MEDGAMHEEFEQAITGRVTRGLSPAAWVLLSLGFLALMGALGAGFAAYRVANDVREEIRTVVTRELGATPGVAAVRMAARLASADELVSMDPERGLALLSEMDGGDGPVEILRVMAAPLEIPDGSAHPDGPDLDARDGASLRIQTENSHVAFELSRTEDGGALSIDSDEGTVRLVLAGGEDSGQLRIDANGREVVAYLGSAAEPAPAWVDRVREVPGRARPVISLGSERGRLGAVAWESDEGAPALLASYADALEAEGYEVQVRHRVRDGAAEHGSLWARHGSDGRMLFVVAHDQDRGRTGVLVGYGERS